MLTIIDRGADSLVWQGWLGKAAADALKEDARRRVAGGEFFGHRLCEPDRPVTWVNRSSPERYCDRVDAAALLDRWRAAAPPGSDALAHELLDRWSEPHRQYHTLAHLAAMLAIVGQRPVVELAVWFHDAVYDPRATDNEAASAQLAERSLPIVGVAPATVAEVARLVRLTATHDPAPGDGAGALLCDADLSILAADPAGYDAYAAAVRREYGHVPDEVFGVGRAAVLRHLLGLPVLYRAVPQRAEWELQARANLTRELSRLP